MKTIEDLKFGFECALGLDDRKYTLEEVLEKVDESFFHLHNLYAITWQKMNAYKKAHRHMEFLMEKLENEFIGNVVPYEEGRMAAVQEYLDEVDANLQSVQKTQIKEDFWQI